MTVGREQVMWPESVSENQKLKQPSAAQAWGWQRPCPTYTGQAPQKRLQNDLFPFGIKLKTSFSLWTDPQCRMSYILKPGKTKLAYLLKFHLKCIFKERVENERHCEGNPPCPRMVLVLFLGDRHLCL